MTPALERALRRREALMRPRGDRGGGGAAGLASLFGGAPAAASAEFGAGGPGDVGPTMAQVAPDQGPGLPGATTGGITAPGKTHFFIRGRGPTIDFGPIFRPRSSGVNPMEGAPFRETTGVGGFFRRLLGDNSNELNDQWQQARINRGMQLADRQAEWDFRTGLAQEATVARDEEAEFERAQQADLEQKRRDLAMQTERDRNWNAMQRQQEDQIHDLTKMIGEQRFRSSLLDKELSGRRGIAEMEARLPRNLGGGTFSYDGGVYAYDEGGIDPESNTWRKPGLINLTPGAFQPPGGAPAPKFDPNAIKSSYKSKVGQASQANPTATPTDADIGANLLLGDAAQLVSPFLPGIETAAKGKVAASETSKVLGDFVKSLLEARAYSATAGPEASELEKRENELELRRRRLRKNANSGSQFPTEPLNIP